MPDAQAQTITNLGRAVKTKHPEYADMPDAVVGYKVKQKFPGSYDDYSDEPVPLIQPQQGEGMLQSFIDQLPHSLPQVGNPIHSLADLAKFAVPGGLTGIPDMLSQLHSQGTKVGKQAGEGNWGGAAGTMAGAVAPFAAPMVGEGAGAALDAAKPVLRAVPPIAKGVAKGAYEGGSLAALPAALMYHIDPMLGKTVEGIGAGAGAVRGGYKAYKDFTAPPEVPAPKIVAPPPVAWHDPVPPAPIVAPPPVKYIPRPATADAAAPTPLVQPSASAGKGVGTGTNIPVPEGQTPLYKHVAPQNVATAAQAKVNNISDYFRAAGVTPEQIGQMSQDELHGHAANAIEYGKAKGNSVPPSGKYSSGLKRTEPGSDTTYQQVLQALGNQ